MSKNIGSTHDLWLDVILRFSCASVMHRLFVYGTLKRGQPNHYLMTDARNGVANFIGNGSTISKWPLVVFTPYHIPFLLDMPGTGKVKNAG